MKYKLLIGLISIAVFLNAQEERKYIRSGNDSYDKAAYDKSEIEYLKALDVKANATAGVYNLGNSIYQQARYSEAIDQFNIAAETAESKDIQARAYHNLGNAYLENKEYQKGIDAYIKSLKINPADQETKYNLAYARQKLKEQQDKGQQCDNPDKQDQQNQGDKKDEQQDDKSGDNQKKEQQQKDGEDKKDEQQKEQQGNKQQQAQMSQQEAERLLQQLNNKEQQVQDKMQKQQFKAQKITIDKDW